MAAPSVSWTREHTVAAFHLYTLLPFGRLHHRTPEIQQLAVWQGRTPSSLAMKLGNFASLDPQIANTGRAGLSGATNQDRELWAELQQNWDMVAEEAARSYVLLAETHGVQSDAELIENEVDESTLEDGLTRTALVQLRVNQARFRKAVLASYDATCCISGLRHTKLVVASHIVPWSQDTKNRLNPQNGLCLSALHDRAFDQGLLTVMPDLTVRVSKPLMQMAGASPLMKDLVACDGRAISKPQRFAPHSDFLIWHATHFGFL